MSRYGRQSPPNTSPWPPPPSQSQPRRSSAAFDATNEAGDITHTSRYSGQTGQQQYSGGAGTGGYGGTGGGNSGAGSRPTSTYGAYAGFGGYGSSSPMPETGGAGSGGGGGGVGGAGGVIGDEGASRDRVNQVIQNFYMKAAMTVIQQRVPVTPLYASRTNSKKVNKWVSYESGDDFNLDLDDTDAFREELALWKNADVYRQQLPPLVVETYIDAKDLTANLKLVLLDERGNRCNVDTAMRNIIDVPSGRGKAGRVNDVMPDVILERWVIDLRPRDDKTPAPELPVAYKHGVLLFRNLYTYACLMPTQKLIRRLAKVKVNHNALKICCRVVTGETSSQWDGLDMQFTQGGGNVTDHYSFVSVDTPAGEMHISVTFRRECDFKVDDSEALLSSHFINLDEHLFQPSLKSHQRTPSQPQSLGRKDVGSLPTNLTNNATRPDIHGYGSSLSLYPQNSVPTSSIPARPGQQQQQQSAFSLSSSPADAHYMNLRSVQGSKSSLRSVDPSMQRRPSVSFMQPFKSPSLSNSPSSDAIPSSPRTSVTRISSTTTAPIQARARSTISPVIPKSSFSYDPHASLGTSASPKPQSIGGRYSSSFGGLRKPRPSTGTSRMEDDNSSGKGSYSSSILALNEPAPGTSYGMHNDDHKVADFLSLLEKQPTRMFDHKDSSQKTNSALVKFQKMRESHNMLSDTLSASVSLQRSAEVPTSSNRQQQGGNISIAPSQPQLPSYSPSSSPGKPQSPYTPHMPTVPSRLSAGHTAEYSSRHHQSDDYDKSHQVSNQSQQKSAPDKGKTVATTSPLDIPSSPRAYPHARRPDSFNQRQGYENDSADLDSSTPMVYGPAPSSMDADEMVPLSLSKLAELRLASEEDLPGRDPHDGHGLRHHHLVSHHTSSHQRTTSLGERGIVQRGFSTPITATGNTVGVSGSASGSGSGSSPSYRGRGITTRTALGVGRGGYNSPLIGSDASTGPGTPLTATTSMSERPLLAGRRTPSYPRGGFGEEEDLLFAMSDMSAVRRSGEQDRAGGGLGGGEGSETMGPPPPPQRFVATGLGQGNTGTGEGGSAGGSLGSSPKGPQQGGTPRLGLGGDW